jgi:hypothetical protein
MKFVDLYSSRPRDTVIKERIVAAQIELTDEEMRALLSLLVETIEADRCPFSPRIRVLRDILAKFGEMAPKPPPPARPPTPEERNPERAPRCRSGRRSR